MLRKKREIWSAAGTQLDSAVTAARFLSVGRCERRRCRHHASIKTDAADAGMSPGSRLAVADGRPVASSCSFPPSANNKMVGENNNKNIRDAIVIKIFLRPERIQSARLSFFLFLFRPKRKGEEQVKFPVVCRLPGGN